tara:strand:+ start:154 stop:633 length:480 start_codon:yes stop_codon:yes gene_type:complete
MHNRRNNKETKTYLQGLRPFGSSFPKGVKSILKRSGYNYSEIISKWNVLLKKEISDFCYPKSIKMRMGGEKATLVIAVQRGNEIEIEYSKKEIIEKLNSFFGYNFIDNIKLESFNSQSKIINKKKIFKTSDEYEKKIDKIRNGEIKNSLYKLLNAIKNA